MKNKIVRSIEVNGVRWYRITDLCESFEISRKNIATYCRNLIGGKHMKKVTKESGEHAGILKGSQVGSLIIVNDKGFKILSKNLKARWLKRNAALKAARKDQDKVQLYKISKLIKGFRIINPGLLILDPVNPYIVLMIPTEGTE